MQQSQIEPHWLDPEMIALTHNMCMWVQRSWGPNRMLMLSWCRGVEGGRIPDEL